MPSRRGIREEAGRPLRDMLVDFLSSRQLLLVIDNCEQLVDAAAKLAEILLQASPRLSIIATSREALGIGGETVLRLAPMPVADADELFVSRALAALPDFELTEANKAVINRICAKVEGLPLAIELAAARLRAMSPEQILDRLADRYMLLTRGSRSAPSRQQTLEWSVGWSYDLCTPAEQRLWDRLSVFAGSFELQAAEDICNGDLAPENVLDLVSSLVDKSILVRTERDGVVRYRMLEILRDYGRERLCRTGEYGILRRRHADWYRRLVNDAAADWFSPRQLAWLTRLEDEGRNILAAVQFGLANAPEIALEIAGVAHSFAIARGALTEGRRGLDRALAAAQPTPAKSRITALYGATMISALQDDLSAAAARLAEGQALVEQMADPEAHAMIDIADGFVALVNGEFDRASSRLESSLENVDDPALRVAAMVLLGWVLEFRGELGRALIWQEKALAIAESHGEFVFREYALWSLGIGWWRHNKPDRAEQLLKDALSLTYRIDDPRQGAACLEGLAWIASEKGDFVRAAVLLASAATLGRAVGAFATVLPHLRGYHDACDRRTRQALGDSFEAADAQGSSFGFEDAVTYALGEPPKSSSVLSGRVP